MIPASMRDTDIDYLVGELSLTVHSIHDDVIDNIKADIEVGGEELWFTSTVVDYIKKEINSAIERTVKEMEEENRGSAKDFNIMFSESNKLKVM